MRARRDPSEPSPRARVRACVPGSPSQSQPVPLSATSRMRKRRGTEALAASLITRRLRRSPSLAYAALPAIRPLPSLVMCVCTVSMYVLLCSAVHMDGTAIQQHSQKRHCRILQLHHHHQAISSNTPATPIKNPALSSLCHAACV